MTDDTAHLFVDVHLSKAKLTLPLNGNCFLIASTVGVYSLRHILLRVLVNSNTNPCRNALYDRVLARTPKCANVSEYIVYGC